MSKEKQQAVCFSCIRFSFYQQKKKMAVLTNKMAVLTIKMAVLWLTILSTVSVTVFAQQWTPSGRRKHVGELLPTQSCFVTEVSHSLLLFHNGLKIFSYFYPSESTVWTVNDVLINPYLLLFTLIHTLLLQ